MYRSIKIIALLMLVISVASATVTVSSDKTNYRCGYDTSDITKCELVNLNIFKTGNPLGEKVSIVIDYESEHGAITGVDAFKVSGKKSYEIMQPFDLPNGNKYYNLVFHAYGSGKFNVSVVGADTGTLYARLDPYWNASWNKKAVLQLNETCGTNISQKFYQFNISDLKMDGTRCAEEVRMTDNSTGTEQEMNISIISGSGNRCEVQFEVNLTAYENSSKYSVYWDNWNATNPNYVTNQYNIIPYLYNFEGCINSRDGFGSAANDFWYNGTWHFYSYPNPMDSKTEGGVENATYCVSGGVGSSKNLACPDASGFFGLGGSSKAGFLYVDDGPSWNPNGAFYQYNKTNITLNDNSSVDYYFGHEIALSNAYAFVKISYFNSTGSDIYQANIFHINVAGAQVYQLGSNHLNFSSSVSNTTKFSFQLKDLFNTSSGYTWEQFKSQVTQIQWTAQVQSSGVVGQVKVHFDEVEVKSQTLITSCVSSALIGNRTYWNVASPAEGSNNLNRTIKLNFSITYDYPSYSVSIYKDGAFNKSVIVSNNTYYSENFAGFLEGSHNFTLVTNESSYLIKFNVNYSTFSAGYSASEYETAVAYHTINISSIYPVLNATLKYHGVNYNAMNIGGGVWSVNVFIPLISVNSTPKYFNWSYWINNTDFSVSMNYNTSTYAQNALIAYYIESAETFPGEYSEGQYMNQTVLVKSLINNSIMNAYMNSTHMSTVLGTLISQNGENKTYKFYFYLPAVNVTTNITIQDYITVSDGITSMNRTFAPSNITVRPINISTSCTGNFTQVILNYSARDEMTGLQLITGNSWETRIEIMTGVLGQQVISKTFGFNDTGAYHPICIEPNSVFSINVSTWLANNASPDYVRRSHFIQNWAITNSTPATYVRMYLLNLSSSSVIDFYVQDQLSRKQPDRIIHFYKYFPYTNQWEELFNLITDENGKATGYLKAYDQWYRLIVTDTAGGITKVVYNTQFSVSSYTLTEELTVPVFGTIAFPYNVNWNNATKIFTAVISSSSAQQYRLKIDQVGMFSNTTYCTDTETGVTVTLSCDLSSLGTTDFHWYLQYYTGDALSPWSTFAGRIIAYPKTTPYGLDGLILTALILIVAGTLFIVDAKIAMVMAMIGLTAAKLMNLWVIDDSALIGLWFITAIVLYIMSGER